MFFPVGKIAEKAVCECIFDMALYFECQINKTHSFRLFFGDFAHWKLFRFEALLQNLLGITEP